VFAAGRWWSADKLDALARRWRTATLEAIGTHVRHIATAIPATPEGVALFVALSALPVPLILLVPDVRTWLNLPPLPQDTLLVLVPGLAHLAPHVPQLGCTVHVLPDQDHRASDSPLALLQSPGVAIFTSGSTGAPRAVFRPMAALVAGGAARLDALGLEHGDGIIAGVSLAHGQGLTLLISSMLLGGPLALLTALNHRAALATLAMPEFALWRATAHFADVLGSCELIGPPVAPRLCLLSNPISRAAFDTFRERFGVPLRQGYSSTETGCIAVDAGPAAAVRLDTVGRPLPSVEVRIGDHPDTPSPSGEAARIWVRSPWQMAGYGFPPAVDRPGEVDGWWATHDLGCFATDGQLTLAGRLDDCIRTRDGRLVNLVNVADRLRELRGIRRVAVVPLDGHAGASFGAVVECDSSMALATLRGRVSDALPPWALPRRLALVPALPLLPNGKPDRQACLGMLAGRAAR